MRVEVIHDRNRGLFLSIQAIRAHPSIMSLDQFLPDLAHHGIVNVQRRTDTRARPNTQTLVLRLLDLVRQLTVKPHNQNQDQSQLRRVIRAQVAVSTLDLTPLDLIHQYIVSHHKQLHARLNCHLSDVLQILRLPLDHCLDPDRTQDRLLLYPSRQLFLFRPLMAICHLLQAQTGTPPTLQLQQPNDQDPKNDTNLDMVTASRCRCPELMYKAHHP